MNNALSFHTSIAGSLRSTVDVSVWDRALKNYENGNYVEAMRDCIRYVNPEIENRFANPEKTKYQVPHGSIIVQVEIGAEQLRIRAPFLDIRGARQVPVMRQVAQLNFSPLSLSRIDLEEEQLFFVYECPLDLCEPYKIYDVLREICINSDNYDDEFITKFEAKRIQEPKIYPYSSGEKEKAWTNTQLYIREVFDMYEQLENKRLTAYLWDILVITMLKIDYYCAPQGKLRNEIEKTIAFMNGKDDYYQRLSAGKEFLRKLQQYERAEFDSDLYRIDVFVPYKFRTNLETVRNALTYAYETSDKEIKAYDHTGAVFTLQYGILNFFYMNSVEDDVAAILNKAMEEASAKPMQDAAAILFAAVRKIMTEAPAKEADSTSAKEERKGFFRKLFGG